MGKQKTRWVPGSWHKHQHKHMWGDERSMYVKPWKTQERTTALLFLCHKQKNVVVISSEYTTKNNKFHQATQLLTVLRSSGPISFLFFPANFGAAVHHRPRQQIGGKALQGFRRNFSSNYPEENEIIGFPGSKLWRRIKLKHS